MVSVNQTLAVTDQFLQGTEAPAVMAHRRLTNQKVVFTGSLLILAPNIVFASGLAALPAAAMIAGCLGYVILVWRGPSSANSLLSEPLALIRFGICLALSLTLLILGGEMHLVYTNWDWLWRDAVLADVARGPGLPTYQIAGSTYVLRAPLGMYLLPALAARATSLSIGHLALLAQNTLLLTCILYMLATIAGRRAVIFIVVFLSFSGLDVIGTIFMWLVGGHSLTSFGLTSHIEWWAGPFQYSSMVTQMFWCPNHALPAYWLTILALLCCRRETDLATVGLVTAASLMWSPFAFVGILPFAGFLLLRDWRGNVSSKRLWLAGATCLGFLPIALYLKSDAAQIPHEFLLFMPGAALLIAIFLIIEIPHVAIVVGNWRDLDEAFRGLVLVAVAILLLLPTVRFGLANDFVMRASIPALMILALAFANALAVAWPKRPALFGIGIFLMLVGAITPFQEIRRSFDFAPYAISDCNLATVWKKLGRNLPTLDNYLARQTSISPSLLTSGGAAPLVALAGEKTCWPDLPIDPYLHITRLTNPEIKRLSLGYKPF